MKIRSARGATTFAAALMGLASSALAQSNGDLDEVWMKADLKTKANLVDYSGDPPFSSQEKVKLETPKDGCYVALHGVDEGAYYVACTICRDASSDWSWWSWDYLDPINDGKGSVANGDIELGFIAEGDDFDDEPQLTATGFLEITPKMKDGTVKKVKLLGSKGKKTVGAYRELPPPDDIEGTGPGKFKLDVVPATEVPQAAKDEFDSCIIDFESQEP